MNGGGPDLIIAGGGLAGCLAALALARKRPDTSFLLIEQGPDFGGNHVWSFFDSDIAGEDRWLIEPLVSRRWDSHDVLFPKRSRTIGLGYNSIKSTGLDTAMRARLGPEHYRLGVRIADLGPSHVLLESGERIEAKGVIDARGAARLEGLDLAWQKFVGRTYRCDVPHGCKRPIVMDGTVEQHDGYRFVYTLPFSPTELMVEDTYYSTSPALDSALLGQRIDDYMQAKGWRAAELVSEETGVLPVALGGDIGALWPAELPVARLGLRGGFFHPTTGYSLPDAVGNAVALTSLPDLGSASLHDFYRKRARSLWKARSFYRLLNRMLFRAAEPDQRYRILEHFYRLPPERIARFYAGRSTGLDKLRILSGKPPVPVGRALSAMRESAG